MAILEGHVLKPVLRPLLHERIRRHLPLAVWNLRMQGSRLLIAQDKADDMHKGVIHKPQRAVDKEQNEQASGWVIAVGAMAGSGTGPHPHGIQSTVPEDLLGLHVYYQMWAGKVFRTDENDEEWGGKDSLLILTDRDIQAWDERLE